MYYYLNVHFHGQRVKLIFIHSRAFVVPFKKFVCLISARIMEHKAKIIKSFFVALLDTRAEGCTIFRDAGNCLPDDTSLHLRRLESSAVSL